MTIKELRLLKGMTLASFAKSIGIGMSTLTGYEAGKRQPGEKALAAIKEVYGVDLNEAAPAAVEADAAPAPATVETAPAAPAKEKKAKKPAAKKEKATKVAKAAPAAKKEKAEKAEKAAPAAKKETKMKATAAKATEIIIQSPMGGEITPEDILAKAGNADKVYVRVDQNKLYIVNGEETSSVDLW